MTAFSKSFQLWPSGSCLSNYMSKSPSVSSKFSVDTSPVSTMEKVTRWLEGKKSEVFRHIGRIVSDVIKNESEEGSLVFADIRQKREGGRYAQQYNFESQTAEGSSLLSTRIPSSHLIRGGISEKDSKETKWVYVPDNTPLPKQLQQRILAAFNDAGRPLRRRNGRYPTLLAITRFFNYLISGRKPGQRRASKKLLHEMGFPRKTKRTTSRDESACSNFCPQR